MLGKSPPASASTTATASRATGRRLTSHLYLIVEWNPLILLYSFVGSRGSSFNYQLIAVHYDQYRTHQIALGRRSIEQNSQYNFAIRVGK
jgi:hypothetical protein